MKFNENLSKGLGDTCKFNENLSNGLGDMEQTRISRVNLMTLTCHLDFKSR